jgi:general stress protein 26
MNCNSRARCADSHSLNEGRTMSEEISTDPKATLWDLIKDIRYAMFTTHHSNGHLHSRPMTTQNSALDEDANLWFFMSRKGDPVSDLLADGAVNVTYADPGADSYVSVSGTASVVEDAAKKQQLWTKMAEAYFPQGVTDSDLALVRVRIAHATYWNIRESKLVQLYQMAKAVITGKPPVDLGEHEKIRMN